MVCVAFYFWDDLLRDRAKANLPYVLWVAAVNTTFLLAFLLLDMYYFPSQANESKKKGHCSELNGDTPHLSPPAKSPPLLEAINKNGLVLFLAVSPQSETRSPL
jgi:phosphatidylinositol glycan class W